MPDCDDGDGGAAAVELVNFRPFNATARSGLIGAAEPGADSVRSLELNGAGAGWKGRSSVECVPAAELSVILSRGW